MMNQTVIILLLILLIIIALNYKKISYNKIYKKFLRYLKEYIDEQMNKKRSKSKKKHSKSKSSSKSDKIHDELRENKKHIDDITIDNLINESVKIKDGDSFLSDMSSLDFNTIDGDSNTSLSFD
jgi:sortase (surface protein transpeptidase)